MQKLALTAVQRNLKVSNKSSCQC